MRGKARGGTQSVTSQLTSDTANWLQAVSSASPKSVSPHHGQATDSRTSNSRRMQIAIETKVMLPP